jgi:ATP-binding cassette subfamily E protein 1
LIEALGLGGVLENHVENLSGGELQRFAILMAAISKANVFIFDEPSSYLDIKLLLAAAKVIRGLAGESVYVICVEHDLLLLDYVSDFICCLYGEPTVYGVVT